MSRWVEQEDGMEETWGIKIRLERRDRETDCGNDSDKANKQQQAVCQAEQITTVEADRCALGLFLTQMEAHTFNS